MKYINADTIFPDELLKEIQRHIPGGLVYIPKPKEAHQKWGRGFWKQDAFEAKER